MSTKDNARAQEFEHAIALLVQQNAVHLSPEEMAEALESIVVQLTAPNKSTPSSSVRQSSMSEHLHTVDLRAGRGVMDWHFHFDQTSFEEVLCALANRDGWGVIEFDGDGLRVQLLTGNGKLYDVEFAPAREQHALHAYLRHKELIDDTQAALLSRDAHARSVSEAQVLLSHPHILARRQAASAVLSYVSLVVGRLDGARFDGGRYFELASPSRGQTLVGVQLHRIVFTRAKYTAKRSPNETKRRLSIGELCRVDFPQCSAKQLGLSLNERQLLDVLLDTPGTVDHLLRISPMAPEKTLAALAGFDAVGLVQRAPESVQDTAGWARRTLLTEEKIVAMYEQTTSTDDPFEILGLHWSCYDTEVEKRYKYLRDLISRTNLPMGIAPAKIKQVREIRTQLQAAHDQLHEPTGRRNARHVFAPASNRQDVRDTLAKLAGDATRQQKLASALDFYQRLLELEPTHAHAGKMLPSLITRVNQG